MYKQPGSIVNTAKSIVTELDAMLFSAMFSRAGVGNIYRAEILYKSRVHPEQPGHTISRATFDIIWDHCVDLLQRGFSSGSILTVDPEDAKALGQPWTRRWGLKDLVCVWLSAELAYILTLLSHPHITRSATAADFSLL
jgi:hypothetical protein